MYRAIANILILHFPKERSPDSIGVGGLVWHWNFSKNSFSQIAKILKSLKTFRFLKKTHFLKSLQILKSLKTFRFLKKLIFSNRQIAQNISFFQKTPFLKSLFLKSLILKSLKIYENWRNFKGSSLSKLFKIELFSWFFRK